MNIKGMLVAVVMAGSAAMTTGCSQAQELVNDAAAQQDVASQASNWFAIRTWFNTPVFRPTVGVRYTTPVAVRYSTPVTVRVAPPVARYEAIGRAPSSNHFWVHGHYMWNGRSYTYVGGHWDTRRAGHTYIQAHYDRVGNTWRFVPGHFERV